MATREKLSWTPWEQNAKGEPVLPSDAAKAYAAYQAAQAESSKARKAFEAVLSKHIESKKLVPAGKEPVFGYNFGKLAIAFAPAKAASAKAGTFKLT